MKICSIDGCDKKVLAKTYCNSHYNRFIRNVNKAEKTKKGVCLICKKNIKLLNLTHKTKDFNFCSVKCFRKSELKKKTNDNINEVRLVLVKWKWGYIDSLLYFRTLSLYLDIYGYRKETDILSSNELMEYCVSKIEEYYNKETKTPELN